MKSRRFQFKYRKSASKLHRTVGDCLRNSKIFSNYEIYQEYPVVRVNTSYEKSSHHFDWVIMEIKVVIECHGKQHYTPTAFDGNIENAVMNFKDLKERDREKKEAALKSGWIYVEVPYNMKNISENSILELIELSRPITEEYNRGADELFIPVDEKKQEQKRKDKERRKKYLGSSKHKEELKKAREYRKEQYRRIKKARSIE